MTDDTDPRPITILDLAKYRGAVEDSEGCISDAEFTRVGLHIFGGCLRCEASLGAYNAHPTKSGYWKCGDCVGDNGFATVEEANEYIFRGFTPDGNEDPLHDLWDLAQKHGEEYDPDDEVGDLQDLSRLCWDRLSEEQRAEVVREFREQLAGSGVS